MDEGIKPVPLTVSVKAGLPVVFDVGEILVVVGAVGFASTTVNVCPLEVPPPGVKLNTVMVKVPALVRSEAGMVAVSWVAEI